MENKNSNTDLRIIRTRTLLRDAFVELIQEMDVGKITVNRLAERATINRVTFYSHYRDIPDMMEKLADEMVNKITNVLDKAFVKREPVDGVIWQPMVNLLEHMAEYASFYKIMLGSNGIPIFRNRLLNLLTDVIISGVESNAGNSSIVKAGVKEDVLIWYDSSALIGTIVAWLENDMPYTPSFLAKQFSILHNRNF